jgi:hypothetical protein
MPDPLEENTHRAHTDCMAPIRNRAPFTADTPGFVPVASNVGSQSTPVAPSGKRARNWLLVAVFSLADVSGFSFVANVNDEGSV